MTNDEFRPFRRGIRAELDIAPRRELRPIHPDVNLAVGIGPVVHLEMDLETMPLAITREPALLNVPPAAGGITFRGEAAKPPDCVDAPGISSKSHGGDTRLPTSARIEIQTLGLNPRSGPSRPVRGRRGVAHAPPLVPTDPHLAEAISRSRQRAEIDADAAPVETGAASHRTGVRAVMPEPAPTGPAWVIRFDENFIALRIDRQIAAAVQRACDAIAG